MKLSVPLLYPGVPAGLTPFRGLVPLGRRNLVLILPPHNLYEGGWINKRNIKKIKNIQELPRLEGASVGCAGSRNSQPTRPGDET
jgi:hypothetical protein